METGLGELEQWKRYDGEFHQALISNCGSRMLMETHALVFDKYFRYQMVAFSYRGSEPAAQHKALLEAALKRDAATADCNAARACEQLRGARARDGGAEVGRSSHGVIQRKRKSASNPCLGLRRYGLLRYAPQ